MKPPPYSLRAATTRDAEFIYQLRVDGLHDYVAAIWGWDETAQAARFAEHFDPAHYQVVVAGQDVGAVAVEWREDRAFLADIEIAPTWRGRGLGTAIVSAILAEARCRGLPVDLQVLRGNPARNFYERLGFRVVGETESHVRMRAVPNETRAGDGAD